jgi:hypothetical protein
MLLKEDNIPLIQRFENGADKGLKRDDGVFRDDVRCLAVDENKS